MGKLDSYKQANPEAFVEKKANDKKTQDQQDKKPVFNLLLKVTEYEIGGGLNDLDLNFVKGIRVDTGEEVKVKLYEIEQKNPSYRRPEIFEFADKRNKKRHVSPENFMVCELARDEGNGIFSSRWAVPLDRDPRGTRAFVMLASLTYSVFEGEKDGTKFKNESFKIKTLINRPAKEIVTVEDFEAQVSDLLTPRKLGSRPEVIVRITDDEGEKEIITIMPETHEVENEYNEKFKRVVPEGAQSVEFFKKEQSDRYNLIVAMIEDEEVKVEVIGASVLYPGKATKEKLLEKHEVSKKHLVESFYVKKPVDSVQPAQPNQEAEEKKEEEAPFEYPEIGYHFCVIGTRTYDDGTPYLTYIKPLHEYSAAESIKDIQVFSLKK